MPSPVPARQVQTHHSRPDPASSPRITSVTTNATAHSTVPTSTVRTPSTSTGFVGGTSLTRDTLATAPPGWLAWHHAGHTGQVRLFVALDLPDEVVATVSAQVDSAGELPNALRWVLPEQWHITLAFYGEVEERRVDDLTERLARAARRTQPFRLTLGDPGRFGSARRARVVWLGLDEGGEQLARLAASARAAGRRVGLRRDNLAPDVGFRPHITLARVVPSTGVEDVLEALRPAEHPSWTAQEAILVRSDLATSPGARVRHTVLERLPFGGGAQTS